MMKYQNIFMLLMVIILLYFVVNYFLESQEVIDEQDIEALDYATEDESNVEKEVEKNYKYFYKVPSSLWPKVTIGGTITAVIVYIALVFGIGSYFYGHNAGGKLNKPIIFRSIGTAVIIGMLGRAGIIFLQVKLFELLNFIFPNNKLISGTISDVIIYFLWMTFIAGIAVYIYETFVVTAKEAYPQGYKP